MTSNAFRPDVSELAPRPKQSTYDRWSQNLTDQEAQRLAEWSGAAPHADPNALVGLGLGGIDPYTTAGYSAQDVMAQQNATAQQIYRNGGTTAKPAKKKNLWDRAFSTLKATSRGAMVSFQMPMEFLIGSTRNAANMIDFVLDPSDTSNSLDRGKNFGSNPLIQTTGYQILKDLLEGNKVDTGSGWFINPESNIGKNQAAATRDSSAVLGEPMNVEQATEMGLGPDDYVKQSNGKVRVKSGFTPGRGIATVLSDVTGMDSGGGAYKFISGLTDASIAIFADPTNLVGGAVSKARRAGNLIDSGTFGERFVTELGTTAGKYKFSKLSENLYSKADDIAKSNKLDMSVAAQLERNVVAKETIRQRLVEGGMSDEALNAVKSQQDSSVNRLADKLGENDPAVRLLKHMTIEGRRKIVNVDNATRYILGEQGQKVVDGFSATNSPSRISRMSKGQFSIEQATKIAEMTDPRQITDFLIEQAKGGDFRTKISPRSIRDGYAATPLDYVTAKLTTRNRVLKRLMPMGEFDPQRPDSAIQYAEDWMRSTGVYKPEELEKSMDGLFLAFSERNPIKRAGKVYKEVVRNIIGRNGVLYKSVVQSLDDGDKYLTLVEDYNKATGPAKKIAENALGQMRIDRPEFAEVEKSFENLIGTFQRQTNDSARFINDDIIRGKDLLGVDPAEYMDKSKGFRKARRRQAETETWITDNKTRKVRNLDLDEQDWIYKEIDEVDPNTGVASKRAVTYKEQREILKGQIEQARTNFSEVEKTLSDEVNLHQDTIDSFTKNADGTKRKGGRNDPLVKDAVAKRNDAKKRLTAARKEKTRLVGVVDRAGEPIEKGALLKELSEFSDSLVDAYPTRAKELAENRATDAWEELRPLREKRDKRLALEQLNGPNRADEVFNSPMQLPDIQQIKEFVRSTQPELRRMFANRYDSTSEFLTNNLDRFWRRPLLARPAFATRQVAIESAMRMWLSGLRNTGTHPIEMIGYTLAENDKGKLAKVLRKLNSIEAEGRTVMGEAFNVADEGLNKFNALEPGSTRAARKAQQQRMKTYFSETTGATLAKEGYAERTAVARPRVAFDPSDPGYLGALKDEAAYAARDVIQTATLRNGVDERVLDLLVDRDILNTQQKNNILADMQKNPPKPGLEGIKDAFWDGALREYRLSMADVQPVLLKNRAASDVFVETLARRTEEIFGHDPEIRRVIGNINLNSEDDLTKLDDAVADSYAGGGYKRQVAGEDSIITEAADKKSLYDKWMDNMFDWFVENPQNRVNSAAFKQFYWNRVVELVPKVDVDDYADILREAHAAKLPKDKFAALKRAMQKGTEDAGTLPRSALDLSAQKYAYGAVKDLFYDYHKKSQLGSAMQLIIPFADAYKDNIETYSKLFYQNPDKAYQVGKLVQGGQDSNIITTDPVTGEEYVSIPGSDRLTKAFTGVPFPMRMRAEGFNLVTSSVLPGTTPLLQMAVAPIINQLPNDTWWRSIVMPYGPSNGLVRTILPPYAERFATALVGWDQEGRQFTRAVGQTAEYLYSNGEYDVSTPEGAEKLHNDAVSKTKWLYMAQGFASAISPAAPGYEQMLQTDSKISRAAPIVDEFRRLQDSARQAGMDFDGQQRFAYDAIIKAYGPSVILATGLAPKTQGKFGVQTSDDFTSWARANPDIEDIAPHVWGYFGPRGDFSLDRYSLAFEEGQREQLTLDERIRRLNNVIGDFNMSDFDAELSSGKYDMTKTETRRRIADYRAAMQAQLYGYGDVRETVPEEQRLNQIRKAADTLAQRGDEAGIAASQWMFARDQTLESLRPMGLYSFDSQDAAPVANMLLVLGDELAAKYPQFQRLWQLLSSEVDGQ